MAYTPPFRAAAAVPCLPKDRSQDRVELFVRLIGMHQYQVHRYVLSLVPNPHDAEDLFQQTNLFLWREFDRFEEGTNFVSWACAVAHHEVLAWRKRKSRERLVFSDDFLAAVSAELISGAERIERRLQALSICVEKLPEHHRELLEMRYGERDRTAAIARRLGRKTDAVHRMLSRIRRALFNCINQQVELESR